MPKTFYDREAELADLIHREGSLKSGEFVVLYGRRRVGKTELAKKFLETITTRKLYFYVDLMEKKDLLKSLESEIQKQLGIVIRFSAWNDFFEFLGRQSASEKFVLLIDEFQRFLEISPEFITTFQRHWDEKLSGNKLLVIAVGSSIGMMHKITQSPAAPLYGRVSTRMKLCPFRYVDFRKMFPSLNEEDKIIHYAVFGGTPQYLTRVRDTPGTIHERISSLILKKGGALAEEPSTLMATENIRTHARYNSILQSIAMGKETTKEMQDYTHIPVTTLPAYLKRLDTLLDVVSKKEPVLGKERHGRYRLSDNFFNFWYKFIFPNQSALNLGNTALVEAHIKENLTAYVGRAFESVVHELLTLYLNKEIQGVKMDFEGLGSWWDRKANEIDIVAYNSKQSHLLAGEVKWTSEKAGVRLLDNLIEKSRLLPFTGTSTFMLVSKSGFTRECLKKMEKLRCIHLDLHGIRQLFDQA